jgi:hypothetical protein
MQKRFRTLWLIILGIILILASIVGIVVGVWVYNNIIIISVAAVCLLLFSIVLIFVIKKNLRTRPLLVIYEKGIIDKSTSVSAGYIGWSEIESVTIVDNKMIAVSVYDLEKVISRLKPASQGNIKNNIMHGEPPIAIKLDAPDMKIEDILNILKGRIK